MFKDQDEHSFLEQTSSDFEDSYDSVSEELMFIRAIIDQQLSSYEESSGANRTVLTACRIKEKATVVDKLSNFQHANKEKRERYTKNADQFNNASLLNDLVGARIVSFFPLQLKYSLRYLISWPILKVNKITVYEEENQKWLPNEVRQMLLGFDSVTRKLDILQQRNNHKYESIHVHVNLNKDFKNQIREDYVSFFSRLSEDNEFSAIFDEEELDKKKAELIEKADKILESDELYKITIEFQLRTLLQHAWAQNEHYLAYSQKKKFSKPDLSIEHEYIRDDFFQLKQSLRTAESMQNLIWNRYVQPKKNITVIKDSIDSGDRLARFEPKDREVIKAISQKLLELSDLPYSTEETSNALSELEDILENLDQAYPDDNLLSAEKTDNIEAWQRQRAILLLLAYHVHVGSNSELIDSLNYSINRKYSLFYSNDPFFTADRIYAFVKLWDLEFKYNNEGSDSEGDISWAIEPLIAYRRASIHYHRDNPGYSIRMIKSSIKDREMQIENNKLEVPNILRIQNLLYKKARYHWIFYLSIADNSDKHLKLALSSMRKSIFSCTDNIVDGGDRSDIKSTGPQLALLNAVKSVCFYSFMLFYRHTDNGKWSRDISEEIKHPTFDLTPDDFQEAWPEGDSIDVVLAAGTLIYFWSIDDYEHANYYRDRIKNYKLTYASNEEYDIYQNILSNEEKPATPLISSLLKNLSTIFQKD